MTATNPPGELIPAVNTGEGKLTSKGMRRREEIVAAAALLFDRVGYHNASLALIAQEVGTTKANVYHYFKAKHDILFAIHDGWIDELLALFDRNVQTAGDSAAQIRQIFHDLLYIIHSRPSQVRVYFEYFRELPEELQAQAKIKRDDYARRVEDVVRAGIDGGMLRQQCSRIATFGLFGMANWTYQWYRADGGASHEEVAEDLYGIFMRGVTA